jgi:hypothetical protein
VTETGGTGGRDFVDFFPGLVAPGAFLQGKGCSGIVAGAAGCAFSHISHGNMTLLFQVKDRIVTDATIVTQPFPADMIRMTEHNLSRMFR